jgi:serine phosphatase RsbU (regulator of sigma subunit)
MLCKQGCVEHTFYVIVEGMVAITQVLEDGQERMLNILRPRQYFGELGMLDDAPRMANCVTVTTTTVLEITEEVFQTVLESSPAVAYSLMRHVVDMMRNTDKLAIADLTDKNQELQLAYEELKTAQAELVEKERLERELEIAADVQRTLLPTQLPQFDDVRFGAYLSPARRVGGDFYDAMVLDRENIGVLLADVADKSVQAALFMAVTRTLFMVESRRSMSPSQVAADVHRGVMNVAPSADIFVTAFYGVLHRPSGRLTYVSAGHERPILVRANGEVDQLAGKGRFLGMLDPLELAEFTIDLESGDRVVVFSDGVPDAVNEVGEQYGYERMRAYLETNRDVPVKFLVDGLATDVARWRGDAPAFDDLTLLILEMTDRDG